MTPDAAQPQQEPQGQSQSQQPQSTTQGTNLNQTAKILTNAILSEESGGDYTTTGKSGEYGGYQWEPGTWASESAAAGVNVPLQDATASQQNQVAYTTIDGWLKKGYNPAQIASMWNAGNGQPDAYTGKFSNGTSSVGTNSSGVDYNVPSYVKSVLSKASQLWKTSQGQPSTQPINPTAALEAAAPAAAAAGVGAAALAPEEGVAGLLDTVGSKIADLGEGALADVGLGGLFGGGNQQQQPQVIQEQPTDTGQVAPSQQSDSVRNSPAYQSLSSLGSTMVGGQKAMKEAEAKGVDPNATLINSGALAALQPDENGIINKDAGNQVLQDALSQIENEKQSIAGQLTSQTSLSDIEQLGALEIEAANEDTGQSQKKKKILHDLVDGYVQDENARRSKEGKPQLNSSQVFKNPAQLLRMHHRLNDIERDYMRPDYERSVATTLKTALQKHIGETAKKQGVQGWDKAISKQKELLVAKKYLKSLPKKVQRDKAKEFRKEILGALAGAAIGKTVGQNTLVGGLLGGIVERRLGHPQYKNIGTKKERAEAEVRRKVGQKGLLSRT